MDLANANSLAAQSAVTAAYVKAAAMTGFTDLTGDDLGAKTLLPGVYKFSSSVGLTGVLTLDANGDPDAKWTFQVRVICNMYIVCNMYHNNRHNYTPYTN
jgi:hypothetical protein